MDEEEGRRRGGGRGRGVGGREDRRRVRRMVDGRGSWLRKEKKEEEEEEEEGEGEEVCSSALVFCVVWLSSFHFKQKFGDGGWGNRIGKRKRRLRMQV